MRYVYNGFTVACSNKSLLRTRFAITTAVSISTWQRGVRFIKLHNKNRTACPSLKLDVHGTPVDKTKTRGGRHGGREAKPTKIHYAEWFRMRIIWRHRCCFSCRFCFHCLILILILVTSSLAFLDRRANICKTRSIFYWGVFFDSNAHFWMPLCDL